MWLNNNIGSWAMFGLGVVLLIVILFRRSARYQRKLRRPRSNPRNFGKTESAPARQPLADAPPEVLKWQVEMHETARDLSGELDSKMLALQALLRQATQQAEQLEAAIEKAKNLRAEHDGT